MKYDDASWHFGGNYPEELADINAYTHIGMFLAWALLNGLAGELHLEEGSEDLEALKRKAITGVDFLQKNCDGKLTDEDLNALGNSFAKRFYDNEYYGHYVEVADPLDEYETVYHIPNSWEVYDKVATMLTEQFEQWKLANQL